ncbi:MAG: putative protein kinase [Streblomastix strix]|uniref:Protein kinase domain-containing protein n=1 Tax=Streblomastix strix TaxID=222440 RepID=A0A5J4ULD6_9EUKA|nr:MAG: putative protein kinase [Streblomastix strix]
MNCEDILRSIMIVPIRPLGHGSFGHVYLTGDIKFGIITSKIIPRDKFDIREIETAVNLGKLENFSPFILKYLSHIYAGSYSVINSEYCNYQTLNVIAQQSHINLPSYTLRALMKQILEGIRFFHAAGLVHRDIKCDNILLHSPPGSGRVYAKIADFGLAKKEEQTGGRIYIAGTLPYMAPEIFQEIKIYSQKVDLYSIGITFTLLITHRYPVSKSNYEEQKKKMAELKSICRPSEIKDDILWDLLSKLLEFDSDQRITAAEALQHPYFTSPEAIADVSKEQKDLASLAAVAQLKGDTNITEFDKDTKFIVAESVIK